MPTKIRMADYGDFILSPESPPSEEWIEYLKVADRLLREHGQAHERCRQSPFSAEPTKRKRQLDAFLSDFTALFREKYTIRPVEREARFLHADEFFNRYYPIGKKFSVLHCSLDLPLHTVRKFDTLEELTRLNAALAGDTPLRWWRGGPMDRPCYLFGRWVWELKPSEVVASEEGLALLFFEVAEKDQHRHDRLAHDFCAREAVMTVGAVSKEVRVAVFRRDHGKCAKCGSAEHLDFEYITPPAQGGTATAGNVQMVCEKCRQRSQ